MKKKSKNAFGYIILSFPLTNYNSSILNGKPIAEDITW